MIIKLYKKIVTSIITFFTEGEYTLAYEEGENEERTKFLFIIERRILSSNELLTFSVIQHKLNLASMEIFRENNKLVVAKRYEGKANFCKEINEIITKQIANSTTVLGDK